LTLAGIFMSIENENHDLSEAEASDVFNQMADTFDAEAGINQPDDSLLPEDDGEIEVDANADVVNAQPADEFDFDSLPLAAQKRIQDLQAIEHKYKSDEGRVGALQRQLDLQQQRLEQMQAQGHGDSAAAQKLEESIEETEGSLDELLEELPELSVIVKKLEKLTKQVNDNNGVLQEKVIAPSVAAAQEAAIEKEVLSLKTAHPDLTEIVSNPEFERWVSMQHPTIAALTQSDSARDVSAALSLYKQANPNGNQPSSHKKITRSIDDMAALPRNGAANTSTVDESSAFEWAADQIARKKL
jgi:hypothetical protein